ncbi:Cytochrome c oxidase subunit 3, partial [Gryllus bimaculatus]
MRSDAIYRANAPPPDDGHALTEQMPRLIVVGARCTLLTPTPTPRPARVHSALNGCTDVAACGAACDTHPAAVPSPPAAAAVVLQPPPSPALPLASSSTARPRRLPCPLPPPFPLTLRSAPPPPRYRSHLPPSRHPVAAGLSSPLASLSSAVAMSVRATNGCKRLIRRVGRPVPDSTPALSPCTVCPCLLPHSSPALVFPLPSLPYLPPPLPPPALPLPRRCLASSAFPPNVLCPVLACRAVTHAPRRHPLRFPPPPPSIPAYARRAPSRPSAPLPRLSLACPPTADAVVCRAGSQSDAMRSNAHGTTAQSQMSSLFSRFQIMHSPASADGVSGREFYFTILQAYGYIEVPFTIADSVDGSFFIATEFHGLRVIIDSVYGSFFIATEFHGLHVIIGTTFLSMCLIRHITFHFSSNHHFVFEAGSTVRNELSSVNRGFESHTDTIVYFCVVTWLLFQLTIYYFSKNITSFLGHPGGARAC